MRWPCVRGEGTWAGLERLELTLNYDWLRSLLHEVPTRDVGKRDPLKGAASCRESVLSDSIPTSVNTSSTQRIRETLPWFPSNPAWSPPRFLGPVLAPTRAAA